jgi:5-methylcytosine-specific restriction endonuclease McrA
MNSKYFLTALDDGTLLETLKKLAISDQQLTAELVATIAEVDARRLYREQACSSMYTYAREVLGMEEGVAYKRIHAARAGQKYPRIFDMLECGELHLSGVTILAPVLTAENHHELLSLAAHKSKREIEKLVAERFPSPDVPSVVRKLPPPKAPSERRPAAVGQKAPSSLVASCDVDDGLQGTTLPPGSTQNHPTPSPPARPPLVKPLSAQRYKVQFTASRELHDKLREAQDLLRHQIPSGDIAAVIEKALTLLVEDVKQRRFGIPRRGHEARKGSKKDVPPEGPDAPRGRMDNGASSHQASPGAAPGDVTHATAELSPQSPNDTATPKAGWPGVGYATDQKRDRAGDNKRRSRYIPAHVRRQVVERDGWRCSFVDANGRRCTETGGLEFHHQTPFAKGGEHTAQQISLFCRAHNDHAAVRDYGAAFMDEKKNQAKERGVPTSRTAMPSRERAFPGESEQAQFLFHESGPPTNAFENQPQRD